jgi:hypothetical protein
VRASERASKRARERLFSLCETSVSFSYGILFLLL